MNHWRGTVFVPKVKLDALLKVLQEPQSDKHRKTCCRPVVSARRRFAKSLPAAAAHEIRDRRDDTEHDVDF